MAEQQHRTPRRSDDEQAETAETTAPQDTERKEKLDDDGDAILGDIDDGLEENAEEFVKNYVQRGGQ